MTNRVKIAAVQMNPTIMNIDINLGKILDQSEITADNKADLIVFPECSSSGYVYASREETIPYMLTVPGPVTDKLVQCDTKLCVHIAIGLLEINTANDRCYKYAVLASPQGTIVKYRKTHLPFFSVDRFVDRGTEPLSVYHSTAGVPGIHICYDCNFPVNA